MLALRSSTWASASKSPSTADCVPMATPPSSPRPPGSRGVDDAGWQLEAAGVFRWSQGWLRDVKGG